MRFNSLNLWNHLLQLLLLTYCKGSQYLDFPSAYNVVDTFPPLPLKSGRRLLNFSLVEWTVKILTLVQHTEEGGVIEYLRSDIHGHWATGN